MMGLNASTLEAELRKLASASFGGFEGFPADPTEAISRWTTAFTGYATEAEDFSGDALITYNTVGFTAALDFTVGNTASDGAAMIRNAIEAFWLGAAFAVLSVPTPGDDAASGCASTGVFATKTTSLVQAPNTALLDAFEVSLESEFESVSTDSEAKALAVATLIHQACTTAFPVLVTGTDGTNPVTNLCRIF